MSGKIFTIGYEASDMPDFLATLRTAGVKRLIDIRELPLSRRKGFSKQALAAHLEAAGIAYTHLKALGNPARHAEGDWRALYRHHLQSPAAQPALTHAAELCTREACALLCYEREHNECHRAMTSELLAERTGMGVVRLRVEDGVAKEMKMQDELFN